MTSNAIHAEIELLRRLHRGTRAQVTALKQLPERSPEDELQLRSLVRLERRLMDRIEAMTANAGVAASPSPRFRPLAQNGARAPLGTLLARDCAAGVPESS